MSHLLYDPAAVHLQRQCQNMVFHLIRQDLFLRLVAMLKELLDHIVPKDVRHELHSIGKNLPESLIFLITVGRLEL